MGGVKGGVPRRMHVIGNVSKIIIRNILRNVSKNVTRNNLNFATRAEVCSSLHKFEVHCVIGAFVYNRTFGAFGVPYLSSLQNTTCVR